MNLNIIGNGFDLYHGLPSSYYYFGCYLISNKPQFYEELGNLYNFKYMKPVGPSIAHNYEYYVEDIFWRDFENHLGEVDEFFIVDRHPHDLGLENDDPVKIEMNEYEFSECLKRDFVHWVKDTLDKDENYYIIQELISKTDNKLIFNVYDYFLQFNYTHTLQRLYKIPDDKIHYVHGECFGEDDDELIIGHGNTQRIFEIKNHINKLEEGYNFTQKMRNHLDEYNCLLKYIECLKKDVNRHMRECDKFFQAIEHEIKCINVYGLSLGEVDHAYLLQIRSIWPNSKWKFSYYSLVDKNQIKKVATTVLDLKEDEYEIFHFSNDISNTIREEITKAQNIVEC